MLERLLSKDSNASLIKLEQPSLDDLCEQIDEHKPQILFFAGHSRSEENGASGYIDLNDDDNITIDDLEPDLRKAVKRGLQLAIFNSCDGLGIARQLANLHVPNIIVMREPVPDEVAQKFLQRFLEAFAAGKPLHLALRRARERINRLENKFPGATWLPVTFQNPAEPPLTWRSLGGIEITRRSNQTGVTGKQSETENQGSIVWLPTTGKPGQTQLNKPMIVASNLSKTQIKSTTSKIAPESSEVQNFSEQLITCINCNYQNPPEATQCEACYTPLPLTQESGNEAKSSKEINSNQNQAIASVRIGGILRGRYRILERLGQGGFGATFLAEDMDRPGNPTCVVKRLEPKLSDPYFLQVARRLFISEAEVLEKLGNHDQIPRLLAYFEENQEFYLVQEFIKGNSLDKEITPGKKFAEADVISLLKEVLLILVFVHDHNVIHRDIKPSNLIRRESDGRIVLIDFGAVKQFQTQQQNSTIIIGTPFYMPPEQMSGQPKLNSDIYALGILAIQALTGTDPKTFQRDSNTLGVVIPLQDGTLQNWYSLAQTSDKFAAVLDRMVNQNCNLRYQSVTEVLKDLERLTPSTKITSLSSQNPKISVSNQTVNKKQIKKQLIIAAWSTVVLILIGVVLLTFAPKPPKPEHPSITPTPENHDG